MSMLIGIVLLISLGWGEFCAPAEVESWPNSLLKVVFLAMVPPVFAAIQVCIGKWIHSIRRAKGWNDRFRTMAIAHSIVWFAASTAIVVLLDWPLVAKAISRAENIPLLNDLLVVAPALMSLMGSWAVFIFGLPPQALSKRKPRATLFALWLRMQVVTVAAPILFAFFVADAVKLVSQVQFSPLGQVTLWITAGTAIAAITLFYPQLMLLLWSTKRVDDPELESRFAKLIHQTGLSRRKIRVWQTGDSIINAAAVGIVPGTEVIIVSDLMLKKFDCDEVDAILLHELGHIHHRHTIKRIAMVLVPLAVLAVDQASGVGLHAAIANSQSVAGLFGSFAPLLPAFAFLIYLLVASTTVFRKMEFEADQFAVENDRRRGGFDAVERALQKMAVIYPKHVHRRSGLHPSIGQRLAFAMELRVNSPAQRTDTVSPLPAPKHISIDPVKAK